MLNYIMLTNEQFKPTKQEKLELQNILNLITCKDKESIKLGKACFFSSNYYKRIRHKNLRIKFYTTPVEYLFCKLTKKLDIDKLKVFLKFILKKSISELDEEPYTINLMCCEGIYYVIKVL